MRVRRVERLQPLPGQDLPTLEQLGRDEPHRHARATSSVVASSASASSALGFASASSSASASRLRPRRRRAVRRVRARQLRRDRRVGLGERVGQVAEDVGRVVVLDDLIGRRASATRPPPRGGPRPRNSPVAVERQPLVVVVDDDQVADRAPSSPAAASSNCSSRRASLRWLRSWYSSARSYRRCAASSSSSASSDRRLAGSPLVGRRGVRIRDRARSSPRRRSPAPRASSRRGRLGAEARRLAGGFGERRVEVGRVVELDELGRGLDDLGLADPLAGRGRR